MNEPIERAPKPRKGGFLPTLGLALAVATGIGLGPAHAAKVDVQSSGDAVVIISTDDSVAIYGVGGLWDAIKKGIGKAVDTAKDFLDDSGGGSGGNGGNGSGGNGGDSCNNITINCEGQCNINVDCDSSGGGGNGGSGGGPVS